MAASENLKLGDASNKSVKYLKRTDHIALESIQILDQYAARVKARHIPAINGLGVRDLDEIRVSDRLHRGDFAINNASG